MDRVTNSFQNCSLDELSDSRFIDSSQEEEIDDELFNMLQVIYIHSSDDDDDETALDYGSEDKQDEGEEYDEEMEYDTSYDEKEFDKFSMESFSLSYMKEVLDYYDAMNPKTGRRTHSWKNVQHRFKRVKHQTYISRLRRYVDQGGTKKEQLELVEDEVYTHFVRARDNFCPVHDIDIKRWAIRTARRIELSGFTASDSWILKFKRKNGICSRKITKVARLMSLALCQFF